MTKHFYSYFLLIVFISLLNNAADGQTLWNGPPVTYSQTSSTGNADVLTGGVALTRGGAQGLYNSQVEGSYTSNVSPIGTEWAYGTLVNYASLQYAPWETWNGKTPPSMLNRDAVLHLKNENIYIGIKFLTWESGRQGGDGGFSYQRTSVSLLPVILKSFDAVMKNNQVLLQWKTASEINNDYFEVERSTNAVNFYPIAKASGNRSSTIEHTYTFTDNLLTSGNYYYRLAQHDLDGMIRYSSIIRLSQKVNSDLLLLPNPALTYVKIISSGSVEGFIYNITSSTGQTMKKGVLSTQQINVQELSPGQYWITIQDDKGINNRASFIKK